MREVKAQDKLTMDKPGSDPFFEIIDIVRDMESTCDVLFHKTVAGIKDGSIPYEQGMERLGKIEKEREKTKAVIQRLEDYLKNVKITEK